MSNHYYSPPLFEDVTLREDRYYDAQRNSDHIRYFWWGNEFVKIWQYITADEWWFYMAWRYDQEWQWISVIESLPYVKTFGRDLPWDEACNMVAEALHRRVNS